MREQQSLCQALSVEISLANLKQSAHITRMKPVSRRKYRHQTAVPVNITLPPLLHQKMLELVSTRGFGGPSDLVQHFIRAASGLTLTLKISGEETSQSHIE